MQRLALKAKTLLYRNFEYVKERDNVNGSTSWRCLYYQSLRCKARLLSHDSRVVEDRQLDHTHDCNISDSLARKAVGKMKNGRHCRYIWTIGNTCLLTFYCSSFTLLTFFQFPSFLYTFIVFNCV